MLLLIHLLSHSYTMIMLFCYISSLISCKCIHIYIYPHHTGRLTHTEDMEAVVSYSITAPPQTHILGRAIAHMGRSSVPFTMDVTRTVHVPAGVFGQTTGQVIAYDCKFTLIMQCHMMLCYLIIICKLISKYPPISL